MANAGQVVQNEAAGGNNLLNTSCSVFNFNGNVTNDGAFTNEAILNWLSGTYSYSMDITNTGYMSDNTNMLTSNRTTGTIDGFSNSGTVMSPMTMSCTETNLSDVLISETADLSTVDFPLATTWYFDVGLTSIAGTYDATTNTFSFATAPTGGTVETLYFDLGNTLSLIHI